MTKAWRQSWWFIQGFFAKYKLVILVTTGVTVLAVLFLLVILPKIPKQKAFIHIGVVGKYTSAQIPEEIERELGPGLVVVGVDQRIQPGVAEKWEISQDGKTYRLFLKSGLKWSNGDTVRLNDLSLNIPQVEIKMIEPNVIEFGLPERFTPFLSALTKPLIKDGVYSLGEYSVKDVKTSGPFLSQVVLDSERVQLVYRFYDSTSQAILAFKLGQIDRLEKLAEKTEIGSWPNVKIEEGVADDQFVGVFYNNKDPFLGDKSVRQALSYAIKDKVLGNQRTKTTINPRSWVYSTGVKDYEYDLQRAKDLIDEFLPENTQISLELTSTPELIQVAEKIKDDWTTLGINVETRVTAGKPDNFQVLIERLDIPDDPDQYFWWHSTQATNFTRYESKRIDKLLEDGRQTDNNDLRKLIYWDFQRFLAEDVPVTVLYNPVVYRISRK